MQSVFMIGEQRSGSNLLRLMLNNSVKVAAPHPPHILLRLTDLIPLYGSLEIDDNFKLLIDDVCKLVETNPVPWFNKKMDRELIFANASKRSLIGVFQVVMDYYAKENNATTWICKSMQNVRWLTELESHFVSPKYIYLYRDPRDVTLSFQKAVVGHKHPYCIVDKWTELQNLCLEAREKIPSNRFFSLKYERLIESPEECLIELSSFLEIEYDIKMLKFYDSVEAKNTAKVSMLWANVKSPLMKSNAQKYLHLMDQQDRRLVESVAGDVMKELGYACEFSKDELLKFDQNKIDGFSLEDGKLQKQSMERINKNDLKRRKRQLAVIENISRRIS